MRPLQIVEVLGPSEQGRSRPYKCRAEDGEIYYVKGRQTNRASLWAEWVCGHLAVALGLAIPPFKLVEVSDELWMEVQSDWRDLGVGVAFGSKSHPSATWLEPSMVDLVPHGVQRDILVFDWWVRNGDRMTFNSNLLWDAERDEVVVIDHNLAFDPEFSEAAFLQDHIFAAWWPGIVADLVMRDHYEQRMASALTQAQVAWDNAPEEWLWLNPEMDVPATFDRPAACRCLDRCLGPELWRTV